MKKEVPKSLRVWFIIHFLVDYIFGLPLLVNPIWFLSLFGWQTIDPFASRLVGAALLGIGGVSFFERNSSLDVYRSLLNLKIIWSGAALIGIFVTILKYEPTFGWFIFSLFAIFLVVWIYYRKLIK